MITQPSHASPHITNRTNQMKRQSSHMTTNPMPILHMSIQYPSAANLNQSSTILLRINPTVTPSPFCYSSATQLPIHCQFIANPLLNLTPLSQSLSTLSIQYQSNPFIYLIHQNSSQQVSISCHHKQI